MCYTSACSTRSMWCAQRSNTAASVVCVPFANSGACSPAAYTAMCGSSQGTSSVASTPYARSAASAAAICGGVNDGLGLGVEPLV